MADHPCTVVNVTSTAETLIVDLADGRTISVPLNWYPRLFQASQKDRDAWELAGGGLGIHWSILDEDLSIEGLLRGAPAPGLPALSS